MIEIGVYRGAITKLALRTTADRGAVVHAIDPAPQDDFDLEGLQRSSASASCSTAGSASRCCPRSGAPTPC